MGIHSKFFCILYQISDKKLSLQKNLFWKSQIQPIFEKGEK
ncbi:hypothetical protein LEP1GSC170_0745 [Leptospira interrogans serovar Bataviae str. HAI135]|nr:hypothetical protein LEP1GSC170_0745 [Leptospira interrogans serovar Bataviae str. HAI135]